MLLDAALRQRGQGEVADELLLAALFPDLVAMQLTGTLDPVEMQGQFPITHPYAKGKAINLGTTTLGAAGGLATADLVTAGYEFLVVLGRIGNATTPATAAADLTLAVRGYEDDGTTAFPQELPVDVATAAGFASSIAYQQRSYLLRGVDKVVVRLSNNNVAALQGGTAIYYLQK